MTGDDPKFAKSVAKQIDRRRMRRRIVTLLVLLAAAIALVLYLRCGPGLGTGGKGPGETGGSGTAAAVTPDSGPTRCTLRLAASGLTVDGTAATLADAITTCRRTTGADVLITGDARQGDWDELKAALEAANIAVFTREPRGVQPPDAGPPDGAP